MRSEQSVRRPAPPRQVESFLEEALLLCQRSEEYTSYLLARMGDVVGGAGRAQFSLCTSKAAVHEGTSAWPFAASVTRLGNMHGHGSAAPA